MAAKKSRTKRMNSIEILRQRNAENRYKMQTLARKHAKLREILRRKGVDPSSVLKWGLETGAREEMEERGSGIYQEKEEEERARCHKQISHVSWDVEVKNCLVSNFGLVGLSKLSFCDFCFLHGKQSWNHAWVTVREEKNVISHSKNPQLKTV